MDCVGGWMVVSGWFNYSQVLVGVNYSQVLSIVTSCKSGKDTTFAYDSYPVMELKVPQRVLAPEFELCHLGFGDRLCKTRYKKITKSKEN